MTTGATTSTPTRTGPPSGPRRPSEQAVDAAIDGAARLLRLPSVRDRYGEIADAPGGEQLSYRAFLSELLLAECDDREQRRAARRVHEAGFPRPKTLSEFDFTANTTINPATVNTLAGCGWVSKGQSLCLIGDSGTGKSDSFSGWTKTFTDPRLCAAIVDRLTFGKNIIETGTSSYRLAHARAQRTRNA